MSPRSNRSASPCLLVLFPVEILEQIYLNSENLAFAVVNKQISQCLSTQPVRLRFCVRLFLHGYGPSRYEDRERAEFLGYTQTLVFRQPWFSNNFARKVQREVLRFQDVQEGTVDPLIYQDSRRVRAANLTEIPKELLLQRPWAPAKVKLIHRMLQWGAKILTEHEYILGRAMMNAIIEHSYLAVNLLSIYCRVPFHHKHFRAAILSGCDERIVEMIVGSNKRPPWPFIDPSDRRVYDRLMQMDRAGNPMGRQILEDISLRVDERGFTIASR